MFVLGMSSLASLRHKHNPYLTSCLYGLLANLLVLHHALLVLNRVALLSTNGFNTDFTFKISFTILILKKFFDVRNVL